MKKITILGSFLIALSIILTGCMNETTMDVEDDMEETHTTMEDEAVMEDEMDDEMEEEMMNEGKEAPDFMMMDQDGNSYRLSDYKGQKVYVKYWASWCSICLAGLDEIDQLSANAEDFVVLTVVTPDYKGEKSQEEFIEWFNELGKENVVVLFDQDGEYSKQFGVVGYPTSIYIGSDGIQTKMLPGLNYNENITEAFKDIY